jgi:hypothetical protein
MKKVSLSIVVAALSVGFFDCSPSKKELEKIEQAKKDSIISVEKAKKDSIAEAIVKEFALNFYSSLELTAELNQKQYEEGGVKFNLNKFNTYTDKNSIYSKKRLFNLTGDYHERYNIKLISVDSQKINENIIELITTVEYSIFELGNFQNEEKLIINMNQGNLILNKWEDIKIKKMEVAEYDGLENFKEIDFYKILGSVNKK